MAIKLQPAICQFDYEYGFLSNFHLVRMPFRLVDGTQTYPKSLEHCFQAAKSLSYREQLSVIACATPGQAKRQGREVTLRWDWEMVKDQTMLNLLRAKFTYNRDLGERLLATGCSPLVEGNDWGDRYWGAVWNGHGYDGLNKLGKLLMQVRSELRGEN